MEDRENAKRLVFVTVGTTSFDALVRAVVSKDVKNEFQKRGFTHLLIQMGRGIFFPTKCDGADGSLVVDYFTFSSSIADNMRSASHVISHVGSGSIFETLKLGKPLIVVVNEDLMDNHQCELAEALEEKKHLSSGILRSSSHASSNIDENGVGISRSIYSKGTEHILLT